MSASPGHRSRPALDELKSACRDGGGFDVLVVWRLDRLARSTMHLLEILSLLQSSKVAFASVTEAIDTLTPAGRMLASFLAAVAEFEREIIRERVQAGLARARQEGTRLGRPRVGFDVNEAIRLKRDGLSWGQLAKRVGVSSATLRRTLPRLLRNPAPEVASISCPQT